MITKFKNTLNKMLQEGIILAEEKEFFFDAIKLNQDWLNENYYHVAIYFGLQEPTSKFLLYLWMETKWGDHLRIFSTYYPVF